MPSQAHQSINVYIIKKGTFINPVYPAQKLQNLVFAHGLHCLSRHWQLAITEVINPQRTKQTSGIQHSIFFITERI